MSRQAQLPNGTILDFPDDTPDAVMDKVVKQHLSELTTPNKGTVSVDQAKAAFAAQRTPDDRTTGQVVSDSVMNGLEGVGQFVAGIPGMAKQVGSMAVDAFDPFGQHGNIAASVRNGQEMGNTVAPLANDAAALASNRFQPSTPEQQRGYQNFAGQNLAGSLAPELVSGVAAMPKTPRSILNALTSPEARAAAAETGRANISPIGKSLARFGTETLNANPLNASIAAADVVSNVASRAAVPLNEALAKFMADGKPYGINRAIPDSWDRSVFSTGPQEKLNIPRPQPQIPEPAFRGPSDINHAIPDSYDRSVFSAGPQEKLNIPRPQPEQGLARAIEEYQSKPPAVLDAPSVNKWMGTKASDLMYGSDPGARLVQEGLIGVDKAATLQKVIPALTSAEGKLGSVLEAADKKGITVDAKSVIDSAIADGNKPFAEGTDETFQKKLDQITTDANSQVEDLSKVKPTDVHRLKRLIGEQINWNAKETTPFQKVLKKIYRGLNDQLGEVDGDIRTTQRRWQDLNTATKNLQGSMRSNMVGRGTPADPLAELLKKRGK